MELQNVNRLPLLWKAAAAVLVLVLTLYLRPYTGIRHDAVLYLGQALAERFPSTYGRDLFFAYGSQAEFTVFPRLLAWLLGLGTPSTVFLIGALVGRLFFVACCWAFVRAVFHRGWRLPALLAVVVMPSGYGAFNIFRYGEAFLTARPFAEGLVLLGLASLVRGRRLLAATAIAAAGLLHPLPALGGAIVAWLWLVAHDRRWLHALWVLVPAVAAAALGIAPATRLLVRFDPQWTAIMVDLNDHCFLSMWPARDWAYWATDVYLLGLVARRSSLPLSRLSGATAIAMIATIVTTLVLGDVGRLAFVTALQAWRVHWIGHLIAMSALPMLLLHDYRHADGERTRALLLLTLVLVGAPLGYGNLPWANAALIPLHAAWPRLRPHTSGAYRRLLGIGLCLAIAVHAARFLLTQWKGFATAGYRFDLFRIDVLIVAYPLIVGTFAWSAVAVWRRAPRVRFAMLAIGFVLLAWSASRWDYRTEWTRDVERAQRNAALFGPRIEDGAQVYWDEQLLPTWLSLGRASYYNPGQQAGQLFNRGTAIEASRRWARMAPLALQAAICAMMGRVDETSRCFINDFALSEACKRGGTTPPPDYLVLPFRQPQQAQGEWVVPDSVAGKPSAHYFLYRCTDLMRAGAPGTSKS